MLSLANDLSEGYEIISKDAFSADSTCNKGCCYTKRKSTTVREFIKPVQNPLTKDVRLMKVANSPSEVKNFVVNSLSILGYSHLRVEEHLQAIAYMIMNRFNKRQLKCRMDLVYSDKCKGFHVDQVFVRSITTLVGPGTELKLTRTPNEIYKIDTGDTLLVKGNLYPGGNTKALHKSPRISHLGISRLLFVMDC